MKLAQVVIILILSVTYCEGEAALRRQPKVYNALITTDEDLVQSRAYPVIQPTIHESGIAHYPFNPYGILSQQHIVRLAQPFAPALTPKEQPPYSLPSQQIPPQLMRQPLTPQPLAGYPLPQNPPTGPEAEKVKQASMPPTGLAEQSQSAVPPTVQPEIPKDPNQPNKMPLEPLPIPLNQYGLPPALIPLGQQQLQPPVLPNVPQPFHLPPYGFYPTSPLYYNTLPGLRQNCLPPYGYLPTGPQFPLSNTIPTDKTYPQPPNQPQPMPTTAPPNPPPTPPVPAVEKSNKGAPTSSNPLTSEPDFENIKNGSKSEDANVSDVPPPPIPSGAKSTQS